MSPHLTVADRILHMVRDMPDCSLEELTHCLSDVSWSDVFLEVDRLSRSGQLSLTRSGVGFMVTLRAL
jgi:hypothetical protein